MHARDAHAANGPDAPRGRGELSEIAGPATLPLDRMMRTLGLRGRRRRRLPGAAGGHARHAGGLCARGECLDRRAWTFRRRRSSSCSARREPWTPVDSLLWGRTMGVWLSGNWRTELARLTLAGHAARSGDRGPVAVAAGGAGQPRRRWPGTGPGAGGHRRPARRGAAAVSRSLHPPAKPPATNGRWTGRTVPAARRCWPATRIWALACPASGSSPASTRRRARWPAPPRRACPSWSWAITATSPGPSPPPAPTPRTCSSKRPPATDAYPTPDGPRPYTVRPETIHVRGAPDEVLHGARNPARAGDQRPRRPGRQGAGARDGQSRTRRHRGARPAGAEPRRQRGRGRAAARR